MSGRCKCCNAILTEWEMKAIDPLTGTYTEFCDACISDDNEDMPHVFLEINDDYSEEDLL